MKEPSPEDTFIEQFFRVVTWIFFPFQVSQNQKIG